MVDWKKIPKIDAHIHLMPKDVIAANRGNGDPFVEYGGVYDYQALMERYHIETAFVMPFNDPYMLSMDFKVQTVHSNLLDIAAALQTTDKRGNRGNSCACRAFPYLITVRIS